VRGDCLVYMAMKVFVAGATGAIGRHLVPQLVERGHEVTGMTRSESKQQLVRELGGRPVVADALDPESVAEAVARAEPEVIVHQLTAIPRPRNPRRLAREFAETNRLRAEGTDHLLAAGRAVGVRRFVAQSNVAIYARVGGPVKVEEDAIDSSPPKQVRPNAEALLHLERTVTGATWTEGVVLRYGAFYGPGTGISLGPEDMMVRLIRKRRLPLIGTGGAVWSFIHIADAAAATVNAIEGHGRGIYNIVDDEPATAAEWLPAAAAAMGAPAPRRVPRWLLRLIAGESATVLMTDLRGASNAKAKRELAWVPRYPSWRNGFVTGLG
jgi:nucleoside-diphosphate-sugar epimerase